MSSEWVSCTLGDILTLQRGMDLPVQDRTNGNYPVVASTGIVGFHTEGPVKGPGVVIGRSGSIGGGQFIDQDFWPLNTTLWVKDFKGNDPRYCYYLLKSIDFKSMNAGSGVPTLNRNHLHPMAAVKAPLKAQKAIAGVLGDLDDRITLLRETNTTLETIAQALFKSWFVDFDPVHAKMQGRVPEGMDQATAALFPDSFEESELGPVPKGWRIGSVEDLCSTITNGGTPSRSKPVFWEGGSIPWFKTGEFHDGFLLKASEFITGDALNGSSVKLLPKDAVLMAIYAAPTVGRLGILTEPATFNQACTGMVAKADIGPWFLFWTLFNGRDWFNSRANGAAQQNISKAIVAAYRLVVPANSLLAAFNNSASSLHDSIRLNSEKAQTLSALRDTLLPRLISGQLRIPKTRTEMESV
ncbi:MAG: restriction endonuclease subunit S [Burkholderiales bacterium]